MGENALSGWSGLGASSPYSADNAMQSQGQDTSAILAGAGMGYSTPNIESQVQNYGGSVAPSPLNGYPMFSSPVAGQSAPSGYANSNPIDATPSVIAPQARMGMQGGAPMNPSMPTQATMNPWNMKSSSQPGSFDYPLGQNSPPPKLNVL